MTLTAGFKTPSECISHSEFFTSLDSILARMLQGGFVRSV